MPEKPPFANVAVFLALCALVQCVLMVSLPLCGELIHRQAWPTRKAAHQATFEYIEGWYTTRRRHSSLGYLSPAAYEGGTVISLLPALKVA